ncbi:MAG: hypothetical protein H7Y36_11775 [Armatimonadetes bacterium]|nr:hypothetical protein [Akkermansiaceae bacterium]
MNPEFFNRLHFHLRITGLACLGFLTASVSAQDKPAEFGPTYRRSWIGNTFGSGGSKNAKLIQNNVVAMWVAPDGRCFTASSWDEAKQEGGIYKDGDVVGSLPNLHPDEGGSWGMGVSAITGDNSSVYVGVGKKIRRYSLAGGHSAFEGGEGNAKNEFAVFKGSGYIWGLSSDSKNERIFATFRGQKTGAKDKTPASPAPPDEVAVVDAKTMKVLTNWPLPRAGRSAVAADGTLWIAQEADLSGGIAGKVIHFAPDGKLLPHAIADVQGFTPTALNFDSAGRLLIADNGPDQQVKIFDVSGEPKQVETFGTKGGIFSGTPGEVKPLKFCGLTGVGVDGAGNICVAQNRFGPEVNGSQGAGCLIESYKPDGSRNWQVHGLEFVDGGDFVPNTDGGQIYSKYTRYAMDYTKTALGSEWSYGAHTLNQFKYPNDPRFLHRNDHFDFSTTAFVRILSGKKFVFNTSMWARRLEVYRFNEATDGEIAIPCGFIRGGGGGLTNAPASGEHMWRDLNGNGNPETNEFSQKPGGGNAGGHADTLLGWWIDDNGGMWQGVTWNPNQLRYLPFGGLDVNGCPIWSYSTMQIFTAPAPFAGNGPGISRVQYSADTDTLYLTGFTSTEPAPKSYYVKLIGRVIARYNGFLAGNRSPTWVTKLWDSTGSGDKSPVSMRGAGDFLFVGYDGLPYQPDSGFVRIFRSSDGGYAGRLWAGPNASGRMDVTYGVSALQRSNGEYQILAEDDWYARQMLYRWKPSTEKPATPVVEAISGNSTVSLKWKHAPGASYYAVERAEKIDGPYTTLIHDSEAPGFFEAKLTNGVVYFYRVTAGGPAGVARSVPIRVAPSADKPIKIDCGGQGYGDWSADAYHDGKHPFVTAATIDTSAVGAVPPKIYQTGRGGVFSYKIPGQVPGRSHLVRLHFSEHEVGLVAWRKFNVSVNDVPVLKEFNIGKETGNRGNAAVIKELPGIKADSKGEIIIQFTDAARFGASVSGIEIIPN